MINLNKFSPVGPTDLLKKNKIIRLKKCKHAYFKHVLTGTIYTLNGKILMFDNILNDELKLNMSYGDKITSNGSLSVLAKLDMRSFMMMASSTLLKSLILTISKIILKH